MWAAYSITKQINFAFVTAAGGLALAAMAVYLAFYEDAEKNDFYSLLVACVIYPVFSIVHYHFTQVTRVAAKRSPESRLRRIDWYASDTPEDYWGRDDEKPS